MRAARLHGVGDLRVGEEPAPVPTGEQSLVRVGAVGLCGSDLHWYGEAAIGDAHLEAPLVLGHECAGVVEGGPLDGRLVAVDPAIPCGSCDTCRRGHRNLCPAVVFAGHGSCDGGLREYLTWPTRLLHPVPGSLSAADAAMLEPLGVALHALGLAHVEAAGTVAVIGCGPIGLCLVQLARLAGAATVVAVDPLAHRREAAARFGADVVLPAEGAPVRAGLDEVTAGLGVDLAVEVAGTDAAVALALDVVRPGARVVLTGIPDADTTTFRASTARRKGLTLLLVRRMGDVYPRTLRLVDRGLVDVTGLVTHRFPLEGAAEAFAVAHARTGLKVIVEPHRKA